jgi:ABC-type phosphate/phosphonate transport system substrate-binding protein
MLAFVARVLSVSSSIRYRMLSAKTLIQRKTHIDLQRSGSAHALRFVTYLAPKLIPFYQFVARYVGQRLGCKTELAVGAAYEEMTEVADVAFLCGLPYVQSKRRPGSLLEPIAAPVLRGKRYGGKPIYFSDVIVRRESPFRRLQDLRGCNWAFNEPQSQSGYGITRDWLLQRGETGGFFGRIVEAGWHEQAVRLVCEGEVDGAAIDSHLLAVLFAEEPTLCQRLRVIDTLGPSTIQPVVVRRQLPGLWKTRLHAALLEMSDDPLAGPHLARAHVESFTSVTDSHYDDIRRMLAAAENANFLTIR